MNFADHMKKEYVRETKAHTYLKAIDRQASGTNYITSFAVMASKRAREYKYSINAR